MAGNTFAPYPNTNTSNYSISYKMILNDQKDPRRDLSVHNVPGIYDFFAPTPATVDRNRRAVWGKTQDQRGHDGRKTFGVFKP